jgi:hypothetical protein
MIAGGGLGKELMTFTEVTSTFRKRDRFHWLERSRARSKTKERFTSFDRSSPDIVRIVRENDSEQADMPDYPKETRDPIANVWGERTPYHGEGQWPVRVDEHIEAPVEKWVQSACKREKQQIPAE